MTPKTSKHLLTGPKPIGTTPSALSRRQLLQASSSLVGAATAAVVAPSWAFASENTPEGEVEIENLVPGNGTFGALRERWHTALIGSYDPSEPVLADFLSDQDAEATGLWETMLLETGRPALWPDLTSTTNPMEMRLQAVRLLRLATAHRSPGSSLHDNDQLGADISAATAWLWENRYHEGTRYGNWWEWEIGTPLALNDLCVLERDILDPDVVSGLMDAVRWNTERGPNDWPGPPGHWAGKTGANLIAGGTVAALRGANAEQADPVAMAGDAIGDVFGYVTQGDGFYRDGSFIQHGNFSYNGGYGIRLIVEIAQLLRLIADTPWDTSHPDKPNVFAWIYDSFEPFLYRGLLMDMIRGRNMAVGRSTDHLKGKDLVETLFDLAAFAPAQHAANLVGLAKQTITLNTFEDFFAFDTDTNPRLPRVGTRAQAIDAMNDPAIPARDELVTTRLFQAMDRAVHRRPRFAFALAMCSTRIRAYESIRNVNLHGWYTGEGTTYIYLPNDLGHYTDQYWPTIDPYRMPGTTIHTGPRETGNGGFGSSDWVGGATLDETVAAIGMEGSGSWSHPQMDTRLDARRSWFCIEDSVVCIGSAIASADPEHTVETILENRNLGANSARELLIDGDHQPTSDGWTGTFQPRWAHLTDVGGYVLPAGGTINAQRANRTGRWSDIDSRSSSDPTPHTRTYLTLWFDHGTAPAEAGYAYVLLPAASADETARWADDPPIQILADTEHVHAVRCPRLGLHAANIWTAHAPTVRGVGTDHPASIITQRHGRELHVTICDPTQTHDGDITVELDPRRVGRAARLISADDRINVETIGPRMLRLRVNVAGAAGASLHARFDAVSND